MSTKTVVIPITKTSLSGFVLCCLGPVDCSVDGYYPDPVDCSKFIVCSAGVAYHKNCPPGLKYNKAKKLCDWPQNVQCWDEIKPL